MSVGMGDWRSRDCIGETTLRGYGDDRTLKEDFKSVMDIPT